MKVKFIGQGGRSDPPSITMFGVTFPLNKWTECGDEKTLAKLSGNSHFLVGEDQAKAHTDAKKAEALAKAREVKAAKTQTAPDPEWEDLDGDGQDSSD